MPLSRLLAVLVLGLPFTVSAAPIANAITLNPANTIEDVILSNNVANGPDYDLQQGPYFWGAAFQRRDDAGKAIFRFENTLDSSVDIALAVGTVLQGLGGRFQGGVTARWVGGDSVFIPAGVLGVFEIAKTLAAGEVGVLKLIFGDPVARPGSAPGIQMQVTSRVAEIPVPPAMLLLLSGLLGIGFLGRARAAQKAGGTRDV